MTDPRPDLVPDPVPDLVPTDPGSPAALAALEQYVAELDRRFPGGFDPGALSVDDMTPAQGGAFLLATADGVPVACGGVRDLGDGVAEIKRMWVHDDQRGRGLGSRLLRALEAEARRLGHCVVRLDTNVTLTEAVAMYERAGYRSVERYNDNPYAQRFFEKDLTSGRACR